MAELNLTTTEHTVAAETTTRCPAIRTSTGNPGRLDRVHRPRPTLTAIPTARFAGLVDIENTVIVHGHRLQPAQQRRLFEALDHHLAGMPVRAASGRHVIEACMPELASRGWGLTLVPTQPDAADSALIEAGRHLAAAGATDLVIVSGDHAFACLAAAARLHVIAHPAQLSKALRLAATTVTYLTAGPIQSRATA